MKYSDVQILGILRKYNYITEEEFKEISQLLPFKEGNLLDYLIRTDTLPKELYGQALAEFYKAAYVNLSEKVPTKETVIRIPETIARKYNLILLQEKANTMSVATSAPEGAPEFSQELMSKFKVNKINIYFALESDIEDLFNYYKKPLDSRLKKIITNQDRVAPELFKEIITEAMDLLASDVHFEPQAESVIIRFRVDGVLNEVGTLSKEVFENILNKIKVQANLRLDDHFGAQDGAIRLDVGEDNIDLRISIMPTVNGQNAVIRILAKYIRELSLSDLGLADPDVEILEKAYRRPFGMILTTGPTGSGKTTTLYSIIKKLQSPNVNITTIEDPVEYKIAGINQIQVNADSDITFAKGLRSIVRQDPNIILVGEIRDNETAEISVNAALTGHLVLSSFHANDSATAIPRLIDMGVEPFLLASTLNLVVAQRLIRTVCTSCRHSIDIKKSDLSKYLPNATKYFNEGLDMLYEAKGCSTCNWTGYRGRVAIFELMAITPELRELMLKNPTSDMIRELAVKQGAHTFFEDGLEKVKTGVTTIEELLRVAPLETDKKRAYGN